LPNVPPYNSEEEEEHWFLGQYWDPTTDLPVGSAYRWSEYHSGTDLGLGMSVAIHGQQFFYMGDTWDGTLGPTWSTTNCWKDGFTDIICNDMIVVSTDNYPNDGIDVSPLLGLDGDPDKWTPIVIPGVHKDFSSQLQHSAYWGDPLTNDPPYTVPTGVVKARIPMAINLSGEIIPVYAEGVVLWYGTAIHPSAEQAGVTFDSTDPTLRPASWVGCSFNGIKFYACYRQGGLAFPFSVDVAPPPPDIVGPPGGEPSSSSGEPARFIQVAAIDLQPSDFDAMCFEIPGDPAICDMYDSSDPAKSGGGLLLYGSGRPYRKSGLFLAFIQMWDLGKLDPDTGRPVISYWDGTGWSTDEQQAVSLTHYPGDVPPCDNWVQPDWDRQTFPESARSGGCWPTIPSQGWNAEAVFGEFSARLIRSTVPGVDS
jgi:hypothetical protein